MFYNYLKTIRLILDQNVVRYREITRRQKNIAVKKFIV